SSSPTVAGSPEADTRKMTTLPRAIADAAPAAPSAPAPKADSAPTRTEHPTEPPTPVHNNPDLRASSIYRLSGLFQVGHVRPPLAHGAAAAAPTGVVPLRRRGLRRRLSAILIASTLGPVIAVSVVAVALIFSSVEEGIEFETVRGLQVARGLFLQEVQEVAGGAAGLSEDAALLGALAGTPAEGRQRLGGLSYSGPTAPLEGTDGLRRGVARCAQGACNELLAGPGHPGLEPADHSPVILRALAYERTVSVERAGNRLVVRAALPLVDPALRLLGAAVISVPVD